jgi:hypothetical protein
MSEIPDEDLAHVVSIQDRIYMTADFVRKWILPTIRVQKALKQSQDQELPGGMEAAMLASIFEQSIMDRNKPIDGNLADIRALRAMVIHTRDNTTHQFLPMEEGGKALSRALTSALQKLKQVAQLPNEETLINMTDVDIDAQNAEIAEAIAQYESHARHHHGSITMLREQNPILAHLVWEHQVHVCDLTERCLQIAEEKRSLVKTEDSTILEHMLDMTDVFTNLRGTLEKRQQEVSEILSPIDFSKISETIKKLKSALLDGNVLNTSLVKKNNSLQVELSFMPREMRERITPLQCENQRKDSHCLIPDGNRFVFQRANPNDPNVSELQTCSYYHSIGHLIKEANDVMRIINPRDTQSDVDYESDHEDQGSNAQGASFIAPPTAPSAQVATKDGEQKGANKRARDTIVTPGHKVHSTRAQRMSQADNDNQSSSTAANVANVPLLQSIAPKATIRKAVQNIATPARPGSLSIPVAQATTTTAQVMVLVDHTTADISSHPTAQAVPVNPTVQQLTAQVVSSPATDAYRGAPEYPHSTFGRYQSRYDYSRSDVPSQDDYYGSGDAYGNPRNYYGNRNPRFAIGKGKGKSKSFNSKGTRNAIPKEWVAA